uniref:Ig-like domain-containing protein n=1 Tax=Apteryx owenii TaxID=8824 RepID=A0A8B9PPT3_APTOW
MWALKHPGICWKDNTARHKQSWRFLQSTDDHFLTQVVVEPTRRGVLLDLIVTKKEGVVEDVKVGGSLGCSDHEMVEFRILGGRGRARSPHSLRYFYTGVSEPSPGLPAFVAVGYVDGETIVHYDSETRRKVPRAAWMADNLDQQYWDHKTERCKNWQQIFHVGLDTLQKRYNQSGGYHTVQGMYGCDILENGGIQGFEQYAYDGRDFLALDKDTLTFTAADAGAEITKREREAAAEAERWKRYLETACIEELRKYVKYGKATLERRERPAVQVSGKESHGLLTLSCRAHGFYPRSIAIDWLRKGRVQAQETKRGSTAPNSDGTYHAWASIEALAAEKDEYQCCVEHASLLEPGLFSWEPESNLLPIVIGVVIAALIIVVVIASFVFWKRRSGRASGGCWRPGGEGGVRSIRAGSGPSLAAALRVLSLISIRCTGQWKMRPAWRRGCP